MVARFQHASDAAYEKYRCPVFKGFVVCVSGMGSDSRNSVRSLVEQNGTCGYFVNIIIILHLSSSRHCELLGV